MPTGSLSSRMDVAVVNGLTLVVTKHRKGDCRPNRHGTVPLPTRTLGHAMDREVPTLIETCTALAQGSGTRNLYRDAEPAIGGTARFTASECQLPVLGDCCRSRVSLTRYDS